MTPLPQQIYRFADIEVDAVQGCVRRGAEERHLRRQTLQVLIYLLEQKGRLVTKEELLAHVWQDTAVTDDALVQCVKDIRRALGDDARHPRFIKTFSKLGYRFIAPTEACLPLGENGGALTQTIETEEITSVEVEIKEETTGQVAAPATRPQLSSAVASKRRTHLTLLSALLVVAVAAPAVYLAKAHWSSARRPATELTLPSAPGKKALAVMHFENHAGDAELDWLRVGLADMLITDLSRSPQLTVLSRQQLHLLLERDGRAGATTLPFDAALDIAHKAQAQVLVLGSFARLGDKVRLDVQLHDAGTGRLLAAESLLAERPEQILTQIDLLSLRLAARLGVAPTAQDDKTDLADVMTDNLEAYRCYSRALDKAQAYQHTEALALLQRAVALDPQFAMAYARIGYIHAFVRNHEGAQAKPYLEKAFQLAHRLTEKDKLYITAWYAQANADEDGAVRALRQLTAQYPAEAEAYWRLGFLLSGAEQQEEKIAVYKRGLAVNPEARDLHNALGLSLCYQGRYDEAFAALQRYVQLAPGEPNAHDSLGMCYNEAGRFGDARAEFDRALALKPDFHFAHLHVADVYFNQGRYRAALSQYQQYLRFAPSDWDRAVGYNRLVLFYWKKGDLARAEAAAQQEFKYSKKFGGPLLVALARGDLQTATRWKEKLFGPAVDHHLVFDGPPTWHSFSLGYYALKSGRAPEAIEHFAAATRYPVQVWNVDGVAGCLADAYLELDRLDEAAAEYERLLRLNPNYALLHFHLAQAYARKELSECARAEYARFLQLWAGADADLPEVVAAKKALAL